MKIRKVKREMRMDKKRNMLKAIVAFVVALVFVLPGSAVFANFGTTVNEDNDSSNSSIDRTSSNIVVSGNNNIDMRTFDDDIEEATDTLDSVDWWPMFQHDLGNTGYSTGTAPYTNDVRWRSYGAESFGSPVVVDGKVYAGSFYPYDKMRCLDAYSGAHVWSYTTDGRVMAPPAVADGKVYVGDYHGKFYCLDAQDGSFIWSYFIGGRLAEGPSVADGRVYAGTIDGDENIYCLDAADGSFIWNFTTGGRETPTVVDGKVYIGSNTDHKVYCLDAQNGSVIWDYNAAGSIQTSATVVDGKVFVGGGISGINNGALECLDATNGSLIWRYDTDPYQTVRTGPAVAYGKVFFGTRATHYGAKVYCLDESNGSLIWNYTTVTTDGYLITLGPSIADGKVFVGCNDKEIYCLDESNGSLIWNYTLLSASWESIAIADGRLYVGYGTLYCFESLLPPQPPYIPSNPYPEDGAIDVAIDVDLNWTGGDPNYQDTVTYDVYFGTTSPPPQIVWGQFGTTHDPGIMDFGTTYYWQIVAWDNYGLSTDGPIWSFTTVPNSPPYTPSNPNPPDHATDVDINTDLSWTGGDPNPGDTVTYDVYFGTSSPPPQVVWNQTGTTYDSGTMNYNAQYYWQIVSWDNHGASTDGAIWEFTTMPDTIPPVITDVHATPSCQTPGGYVNITAMVTDNVEVDMVYLYILYPDSSVGNFSITQNKTGDVYYCNRVYGQVGVYAFHVWAADIDGNAVVSDDHTFEIILDTTPPVTTHEFDPETPDGDNGWYVSDVIVTLVATDDLSGVDVTYYRIDEGGGWDIYSDPIEVSEDGLYALEYYSVDNVGNEELPQGPFDFKIDQTDPTIELYVEKIGFRKWLFTANAIDATSGVDRVEFYYDDELLGEVTEGPFEWTYSGSCGENATAVAYDNAGNSAEDKKPVSHSNQHIVFTFLERFIQRFPILERILSYLDYCCRSQEKLG